MEILELILGIFICFFVILAFIGALCGVVMVLQYYTGKSDWKFIMHQKHPLAFVIKYALDGEEPGLGSYITALMVFIAFGIYYICTKPSYYMRDKRNSDK